MKITERFDKGEFVITAEVGPSKGINIDNLLAEAKEYLSDISAVNGKFSDDHFEKCGFSGPIDTYKCSLFSVFYMKRTIFDDDLIAKSFV